MDREAIEFHDSVLARVERTGDEIRFMFEPAYVHRSSGQPAHDAGTGWSVDVQLILFGCRSALMPSALPSRVWNGGLRIAEADFENIVLIPFETTGDIQVRIELTSGEVVEPSGRRAQMRVVGPYTFVENVSLD